MVKGSGHRQQKFNSSMPDYNLVYLTMHPNYTCMYYQMAIIILGVHIV